MISDLDKNKSGTIDFEEFLDMMTARMSDKDTREDITKVFRLFDDDNTGTITLRNLRRVARELGETMTDEWESPLRSTLIGTFPSGSGCDGAAV